MSALKCLLNRFKKYSLCLNRLNRYLMRFAIAYAHANKALSASCPARQGCIIHHKYHTLPDVVW